MNKNLSIKLRIVLGLISGFSLLDGCSMPRDRLDRSIDQKDYQALANEKVAQKPVSVMGVDIWKSGVPNHKYTVLGMVTDKRKNADFNQSEYELDISRFIRKAGGDAGIVLLSNSKVEDKVAQGCGASIGNSSSPDGCPGGDFSTFYSANIEGTNGPIEYKISHIVIIKYVP
jgi:hypothetical protein